MAYYSTEVKAKDFQVWIFNGNTSTSDGTSTLAERLAEIDGTTGNTIGDFVTFSGTGSEAWNQFGELRRDSIVDTLGEGNSVEGNNIGKVVVDKDGSFAMELINLDQDQLTELDTLDRSIVCLLKWDVKNDEAEFFPNYQFVHTETHTGGEAVAIPLTFNKNVSDIESYSVLLPVTV
jgi:hypothetical protein